MKTLQWLVLVSLNLWFATLVLAQGDAQKKSEMTIWNAKNRAELEAKKAPEFQVPAFEDCVRKLEALFRDNPAAKRIQADISDKNSTGEKVYDYCVKGLKAAQAELKQKTKDQNEQGSAVLLRAIEDRGLALERWEEAKKNVGGKDSIKLCRAETQFSSAAQLLKDVYERYERTLNNYPNLANEKIPAEGVDFTYKDLLPTIRQEQGLVVDSWQKTRTKTQAACSEQQAIFKKTLAQTASGDRKAAMVAHGQRAPSHFSGDYDLVDGKRNAKLCLAATEWNFEYAEGTKQCKFVYKFKGNKKIGLTATPGCQAK